MVISGLYIKSFSELVRCVLVGEGPLNILPMSSGVFKLFFFCFCFSKFYVPKMLLPNKNELFSLVVPTDECCC